VEFVRATYRLDAPPHAARERAELLALEQSVELPRETLRDERVVREVLPRVESIEPDAAGGSLARIAYPIAITGSDPAQLLNVLFGNCSLQPDVALADCDLPEGLLDPLGGPHFGLAGLRRAVGEPERGLTCTALKPMGLDAAALGELCFHFARAGIDVIKDDHGLSDQPFCRFVDRVHACLGAVERAVRLGARRALYVPNLNGAPEALAAQLEIAQDAGVRALLAEPMVIGLPLFRELTARARMPVFAHPALAGSLRIRPELWLGRLFRAYGADAVIYPHSGGRFSYDEPTCARIARRLTEPLGGLEPSLPVPAGGMTVERVPELLRFYGPDVMLLLGGSLYRAGSRLEERAREFVDAVARASPARGSAA
jgi:ribulose-bisphosphate carboxylase large chain